MGKSSGAGAGGGGLTDRALAAANVSGSSAKTLQAAWRKTFGSELTSVSQIHELSGLTPEQVGKFGAIRLTVGGANGDRIVLDASGSGIQIGRSYTPGNVYHGHLFIASTGKGLGTKVLKSQVAAYRRYGIKNVSLVAAQDGRAVWPKMGFQVTDKGKMREITKAFRADLKKQGLTHPGRITSIGQIARMQHNGRKVGETFLKTSPTTNLMHMNISTRALKEYLDGK